MTVTYPEFLGRPVPTLKPRRHHHGWHGVREFSIFVPPDALKMHSLLDFFVNYFLNNFSFLWMVFK